MITLDLPASSSSSFYEYRETINNGRAPLSADDNGNDLSTLPSFFLCEYIQCSDRYAPDSEYMRAFWLSIKENSEVQGTMYESVSDV